MIFWAIVATCPNHRNHILHSACNKQTSDGGTCVKREQGRIVVMEVFQH
jgi:hypothetical protein